VVGLLRAQVQQELLVKEILEQMVKVLLDIMEVEVAVLEVMV
jgi:hypothetical protein